MARRYLIPFVAVGLLLLALGALPAQLQSGDPYYLTATPADASGPAVDGGNLSERRFPYTTTAIREGRSDAYYRGPVGIKGAFTHSPFDELDGLRTWRTNATAGDDEAVYVSYNGTRYRLEIVHERS